MWEHPAEVLLPVRAPIILPLGSKLPNKSALEAEGHFLKLRAADRPPIFFVVSLHLKTRGRLVDDEYLHSLATLGAWLATANAQDSCL